MKYYLDSEFIEDGKTIDLLSIALVAEDGRKFYAINTESDQSKASDWVKMNVIPYLALPLDFDHQMIIGTCKEIAEAVINFIGCNPEDKSTKPEFWGYYADYDWVVFCQLFGTMMNLPKGFPMFCMDLKQLAESKGNPKLPKQNSAEHHALFDAQWNKSSHEWLLTQ